MNGSPAPESSPSQNGAPLALTEDSLPRVWEELLEQVGPLLGTELRKAHLPAISGPNTLVLRFPAGYNDTCQSCQEPSRQQRIESVLRKLIGVSVKLRMEVIGGAASSQAVPETASHGRAEAAPTIPRYRRQRAEAEQEPLLRRAIDGLGAQIVRMDDGFGSAPPPQPVPARNGVGDGVMSEEEM